MNAHEPGGQTSEQELSNKVPLYRQVVQTLKQEIVSGVYPVDSQLPPETKLRERFKVSRHTIREALRELRDAGLVSSRQGLGTTVLRPGRPQSYVHEVASVSDLIELANATRYEVGASGTVTLDRAVAGRIGAGQGEQWLRIEGFRYAPEESRPVCWTEVYVQRQYAGVARLIGRRPGAIYQLIEDLYAETIDKIVQTIATLRVPAQIAETLGAPRNAVAIDVRRNYLLPDGTTAEAARNIYPADRFQLSMTMRRSRA